MLKHRDLPALTDDQARRFHAKVRRGPGCWTWTAATRKGYGHFKVGEFSFRAHRVAWRVHHGPVPAGSCVCHRCDNPSCVNPDHLFLGTHDDNMKDMARKGRVVNRRGADNNKAKMSDEIVAECRRAYNAGATSRDLARKHGVTQTAMAYALRGDTYKHISEPPCVMRFKGGPRRA